MTASSAVPLWSLRLVWALQPLAFVPFLGDATTGLESSGRLVLAVLLWLSWAAVLFATLVPSTVSLSAGRLAAPMPVVVVAVVGCGPGAAGWKTAIAAAAGAIALLAWLSGEIGAAHAQGSAYGAEQRFPLKPPAQYLVPMAVSWVFLAGCSTAAAVLLADESWVAGVVASVLAAGLARFVGPRFHLLSRRWLVVVPVGVVIHDPMLLVENALFRTQDIQAIHLAPSGTEAADLTGGTAGVAVEVVLRDVDTVVKVGASDQPTGVALHVRSVLVAPTRPGSALAACAARSLPVG